MRCVLHNYLYLDSRYKEIIMYLCNMKFIRTLLERFVTDDKKILGRWNIEYCVKKMDYKIDLANEDHCGPCGQYILHKSKKESNEQLIKNN